MLHPLQERIISTQSRVPNEGKILPITEKNYQNKGYNYHLCKETIKAIRSSTALKAETFSKIFWVQKCTGG